MNLYEQLPYWLMKDGIVANYPSLDTDLDIDVAVIGAGISGALTAWHLLGTGMDIAVFDRSHAGMGSTAASTAFLQYEIDTPLYQLAQLKGEKNAVACYRLCKDAIYDIGELCKKLKPAFDFDVVPSLQHASFQSHLPQLKSEYALRKKHHFDCEWLEQAALKSQFGLVAPAGILNADGGQVDAYLLTHALFKDFREKGHHVYNNTSITDMEHHKNEVCLKTKEGVTVRARHLVIACGYESLKYVPKKIADIQTTYALVSEPLPKEFFWHRNSLIWETATPYVYFRVVSENRILIGGKDDPFHRPNYPPSVIKRKSAALVHAFKKRMPHIPLKPDFSWAGAFATTSDGLPFIGSIRLHPNTYFALGFGGNGITFSVIAARIIRDLITGRKNKEAALFGFDR